MNLDLTTVISALLAIVGGGTGVFVCTEAAKRIKLFPINKGQKLRLRSVAAVLSAVVAVLFGVSNGTLDGATLQDFLQAALTACATWGAADSTYRLMKEDKKVEQG
uniref:Uncharacterized protein n=1 Tax=viral metagenome TaxID=1070528 RepID=A0A6H1ZGH2_9ZZZZ